MLQGEHSAILSAFIKLPFVIKTFVLSIFEWSLKTGFTVSCVTQAGCWWPYTVKWLGGTYRICSKASFNDDVFSGKRGLNFGLRFYLHLYFLYASNKGSVWRVCTSFAQICLSLGRVCTSFAQICLSLDQSVHHCTYLPEPWRVCTSWALTSLYIICTDLLEPWRVCTSFALIFLSLDDSVHHLCRFAWALRSLYIICSDLQGSTLTF